MPDEERLGERLLLANARVRVWRDAVAPGAEQPLHTHRRPYLSIVVRGGDGVVVNDAGSTLYELHRAAGDATYFGPDRLPVTHSLRNTGESPLEIVVVELLDASAPDGLRPGASG